MALQFESLGSQFADFVSDPTSEASVAWADANHLKVSHTPSLHGVNYHIVRYDRSKFGSDMEQIDMPNAIRMLRSVIIANGRIVSVSLPKCLDSSTIGNNNETLVCPTIIPISNCLIVRLPKCLDSSTIGNNNETLLSHTIMEEGPMVNVFYVSNDDRIKDEDDNEQFGWQIATRSVIGARNSYYDDEYGNKVTFREMFLEAMPENLFSSLNRNCCYSFVIRHPKNRDVYHESKPHLLLTAAFCPSNEFMTWNWCYNQTLCEGVSNVQSVNTSSDNRYLGTTKLYVNSDGGLVRTKTISEDYPNLRKLRGTQPKLLFHYLALRKQRGVVGQYLTRYPEHSVVFDAYRNLIHSFTNELYKSYIGCYVKRERPLGQYDGKFKQHMYNIHESFKQKRESVHNCRTQMSDVIQYVNNLEPAQLMYVLNWERHADKHQRRQEAGSSDNMEQ